MIAPPATVGMHLSEVDTPALILDLDALEANIACMQAKVAGTNAYLRPHAKTHKSVNIARLQLAAGARGVCCQKVSEAEIMVGGGVGDVFVSNEVIGAPKIARLAALARTARISVCVDDANNVDDLAKAAASFGSRLTVLVELNVGMNRCGVETPAELLELARRIAGHGSLSFGGIQAYHGSAQHVRDQDERRRAIRDAGEKVLACRAALEAAGLPCPVVAGAGTGTFEFELASGIWNELQVGSYVFMDADYGRNLDATGAPVCEFANSLFILSTVLSRPVRERGVVDAGLKALSVDSGMPDIIDTPGVEYVRAADEHGRLALSDGTNLSVGQKLRLIPGHCDPTVNLYDWFVGFRGDRVEALWPVSARGALL